jgi:ketosteroid isomerase-like protein
VATQQYYGDVASFGNTLKGYGITAFEVSPQVESGDEITVVGAQEAQGMAFPYTWVFAKGDDGSWLVKARQMGATQ